MKVSPPRTIEIVHCGACGAPLQNALCSYNCEFDSADPQRKDRPTEVARYALETVYEGGKPAPRPRPKVVCLCGSARFKDEIVAAYAAETDAGRIVLSLGRFVPDAESVLGVDRKAALDELHLRKIDLADEVLVIDADGGYVGKSTRREIEYATITGKPVRYWSQEHA